MRKVEPYRVIVADPPWQFGDALPGPKRGATSHYETLSLGALKNFPLPPIADDAMLLLWRVAAMQQEALDVVKAWGFKVKSEIVKHDIGVLRQRVCLRSRSRSSLDSGRK